MPKTLLSNKCCCGHTEGAAGITGLLLAMGALRHAAAPAVMHLRNTNQYVAAALSDWSRLNGTPASLPRQAAPAVAVPAAAVLSGTSSFGMSGVNAHMLVGQLASSTQLGGFTYQVGAISQCLPIEHEVTLASAAAGNPMS